jgi:hypothetical protein
MTTVSLAVPQSAFANVAPSPSYPYVAVGWSDWVTQDRLQVLRLPNLEPVVDIELLGDAALEAAGEFDPYWEDQDAPVVTRIRRSLGELLWSPNGRYLAFVAAMDGPSADVYVFDAESEAVRRLTSGPNQAHLMGWSPDSRWIVHASILYEDVELVMEAVWAVSPAGGQASYLYRAPEYAVAERILGWPNASQFLAQTTYFETCSGDVYEVTIPSGERTTILALPNTGAEFDPVNATILFTRETGGFCRSEPPGVFAMDLRTLTVTEVLSGNYYWVQWSPNAAALWTIDWSTEEVIYFSSGGRIIARFPRCCGAEPSPRGEYFAVPHEEHLEILSRDGVVLVDLPTSQRGSFIWLPDASGLVRWWRSGDGVVHVEVRLAQLGWLPASSTEFGTSTSPDGAWIVWTQEGES